MPCGQGRPHVARSLVPTPRHLPAPATKPGFSAELTALSLRCTQLRDLWDPLRGTCLARGWEGTRWMRAGPGALPHEAPAGARG